MNEEEANKLSKIMVPMIVDILYPLIQIEIGKEMMKMRSEQSKLEFPKPIETKEEKKEKSVLELTSYCRYVFADASEQERSIMEEVIKRFELKYANR